MIATVADTIASTPLQDLHDAGPSSRAMAKVMAGGALTTEEVVPEEPEDVAPAVKRRRRAWMVTLFVLLANVKSYFNQRLTITSD